MKKRFSRGVISEYLPWVIIAIAVLAVFVLTITVLKENGVELVDQLKNLFRGR